MRDAAVVQEIARRAAESDDEVEIGCGAGEEAGRDPPRQRMRRRIARRRRAREKRAGKRVR
jgi:hypothetical protein